MGREIGWLLVTLGLVLVVVSVVSVISFRQSVPQTDSQVGGSFGGVLMIGPIPIVFGSSPEMAVASMLLAVALMVASFLLFLNTKRQSDEKEGLEEDMGIERNEKSVKSEKSEESERTRMKGGAVVMIGPIPIVMGSDPRIALIMMFIALAAMVLWILWASSGR